MADSPEKPAGQSEVAALKTSASWENVFQGDSRNALEGALPQFMLPRRWFGSKARAIRAVHIVETVPLLPNAYLATLQVDFLDGGDEMYQLPVGYTTGAPAQALLDERPAAVIARLLVDAESGVLYDAVWDPDFCKALLETIARSHQYRGTGGDLVATATDVLAQLRGDADEALPPVLLGVEQSNTSVRYGERLILKLYRRLAPGINPDQEIGQFLTQKAAFANTPPLAGVLEFRRRQPASAQAMTVALLQGFVPNRGDAWRYTLDSLGEYFDRVCAQGGETSRSLALPEAPLLQLAREDIPEQSAALIGPYLESANLLGRRTAELHLALASYPDDPAFAPEPFTHEFQSYLHRSMRELTDRTMRLLRTRLEALPDVSRDEANRVLALEEQIASGFGALLAQPIHAVRSRIHGDYHLGQVLYTGDDFMIIDFEGEPARPLSERQMKRSPLQDVAGMLRSFHYAAYSAYLAQTQQGTPRPELEAWARFWHRWVSVAYLKAYLDVAGRAAFLPASRDELKLLLDAYLVEKAVYELAYELNNRPSWARIPLLGILQTVGAAT